MSSLLRHSTSIFLLYKSKLFNLLELSRIESFSFRRIIIIKHHRKIWIKEHSFTAMKLLELILHNFYYLYRDKKQQSFLILKTLYMNYYWFCLLIMCMKQMLVDATYFSLIHVKRHNLYFWWHDLFSFFFILNAQIKKKCFIFVKTNNGLFSYCFSFCSNQKKKIHESNQRNLNSLWNLFSLQKKHSL